MVAVGLSPQIQERWSTGFGDLAPEGVYFQGVSRAPGCTPEPGCGQWGTQNLDSAADTRPKVLPVCAWRRWGIDQPPREGTAQGSPSQEPRSRVLAVVAPEGYPRFPGPLPHGWASSENRLYLLLFVVLPFVQAEDRFLVLSPSEDGIRLHVGLCWPGRCEGTLSRTWIPRCEGTWAGVRGPGQMRGAPLPHLNSRSSHLAAIRVPHYAGYSLDVGYYHTNVSKRLLFFPS